MLKQHTYDAFTKLLTYALAAATTFHPISIQAISIPTIFNSQSGVTKPVRRSDLTTLTNQSGGGEALTCGGMPASWRPYDVVGGGDGRRRRSLLSFGGARYVMPFDIDGRRRLRVPTEGAGVGETPRTTSTLKDAAERSLAACLRGGRLPGGCSAEARAAARRLPGVKMLISARSGRQQLGPFAHETLASCAAVGNSGSLLKRRYGDYIDRHGHVVRSNLLPITDRLAPHTGRKCEYRVLSYKSSRIALGLLDPEDVAEDRGKVSMPRRGKWRPDHEHTGLLLWYPASAEEVARRLRARFRGSARRTGVIPSQMLRTLITSFTLMRRDLARLGLGPFGPFAYLTSGMHAVLSLAQTCSSPVSVFGYSVSLPGDHEVGGRGRGGGGGGGGGGPGGSGPYWFTGRRDMPRSGRNQHGWSAEKMVFRLLHAAGIVNICSS